MNARKQITACLLILSLIAPFLWQIKLRAHLKHTRYQMKEKLERSVLTSVTLPLEEVSWAEHGVELNINGRLFDIKSQYPGNGYITFTGLYDDAEKALEDIADGSKTPDWLSNLVQKLFNTTYDDFFTTQPAIYALYAGKITAGTTIPKKYSTPFTPVAAPPPWPC